MARLLVGQYQQTGPMVPKKFLNFHSIGDPCSAPATWNNLFPFGCDHVIVEANKLFHMNRF